MIMTNRARIVGLSILFIIGSAMCASSSFASIFKGGGRYFVQTGDTINDDLYLWANEGAFDGVITRDLTLFARRYILTGEVSGIVDDPTIKRWAEIDLANRAFGQGVAVTLVQLARSYAAMVNGGYLVEPHFATAVGGREIEQPERTRVLTASLSKSLVSLLKYVVTEVPWYAKGTLIPGYLVGGKTGTAQIWDSKKHDWVDDIFNFTFVGFLGRTKPEYIIAVRLDRARPEVVRQGVLRQPITSNELFRRVALNVIQVLDLPPAEAPGAGASPAAGSSASPRPSPKTTTKPAAKATARPTRKPSPLPSPEPSPSPSDGLPGWAP